jgi:hypothetical protein
MIGSIVVNTHANLLIARSVRKPLGFDFPYAVNGQSIENYIIYEYYIDDLFHEECNGVLHSEPVILDDTYIESRV